ncbi:MAG: MurR/RpiR family transcriptional regulator, partial [Coprobacillus sp.]
MLIIHKIENTHFSTSEAIIINYILERGENIKDMTVNEIAQATYTSGPLLIRIAKKLGFSGWSEFKDNYLKELDYMYATSDIDASIPFVVSDDFMTIAHNIGQLEIETLQDTMKLLNHDDLQKVMRLVRNAQVIDMYGVSNHVLLAEEFAEKMFFINKEVHICRLTGDAKMQAAMSHSQHCAILISYSGETSFMIQVAQILKTKNTPIIAITSIADNT